MSEEKKVRDGRGQAQKFIKTVRVPKTTPKKTKTGR